MGPVKTILLLLTKESENTLTVTLLFKVKETIRGLRGQTAFNWLSFQIEVG